MDHTPIKKPFEISHLELRGHQAPVAVCLIKEFAKTVGFNKALEISTAAIQSDAMVAGRAMAEKLGCNTLKDIAQLVREIWSKNDAMTAKIS